MKTWKEPETLAELVLVKAVRELIKPVIDFERPNSHVVVHHAGDVFSVGWDGTEVKVVLHDEEDDPVRVLDEGTRFVEEPAPN